MMHAVELTILLGAAFLISWLWRPRGAAEPGVRMLLISYALLGGWALWFGLYSAPGQEPAGFLFWKPTVMYWLLSIILVVAPALRWGYPIKAIIGTFFAFSDREWRWINLAFAVFFALLGGFNLFMAFTSPQRQWEEFKWSCMVNVLGVLLLRMTFLWIDTVGRAAMYLYGRAKAFFQ